MTVTQYDPSQFGNVGMEDVDASDLIIPRLQIDHKKGVFRDNLSKEEFSDLKVVILGLVKQRTFWDSDVEDGDQPLCKSPDFESGFPQMREDIPSHKRFPWQDSNFNPADFPAANGINGLVTLPCDSCNFAQWGKNQKTGKSTPPPCAELHTYPLMYTTDDEEWTTALVSFKGTGIKPSKNYLSSFAQSNRPMFTSYTNLSLNLQSRGSVEYSVPIFRRGEETDRTMWQTYADTYRQIRDFVRTPPRNQNESEAPAASSNVNSAPTQEPVVTKPVESTVVQPTQPEPQYTPPSDDLPF